jgi:hypothetical protein
MTQPITPPPELVQQWRQQVPAYRDGVLGRENWLMSRATQWGADQELEACIDWISVWHGLEHPELLIELLRAARRPKPPSLKEQALAALNEIEDKMLGPTVQEKLIRRALETLPE